jgi:heme-degrading monooxygenase HmoA
VGVAPDHCVQGARLSNNLSFMIVVTNRIPVAEGHEIDFEDRFKQRVHLVDRAPGFVRNEVHRPRPLKLDHASGTFVEDPDAQGYYEVKTWWRTLEDFVAWTRSPAFAEAHRNRAPKEMFRGANVLEIHELLTSTDLDPG